MGEPGRPAPDDRPTARLASRVGDWLSEYGRAWEQQDADLVGSLFSPDARYSVNPFEKALTSRAQIVEYWLAGAAGTQSDIRFAHELWFVADHTAVAHWTACFTRTRTGERVDMDGVFRLRFTLGSGDRLTCSSLEEWWFVNTADRA